MLINGVSKKFVPFWIDAAEDIENDPYTTDCSDVTTETNPHAYTELSIQNGALNSVVCIKKLPGNIYDSYDVKIPVQFLVFSAWGQYSSCSKTCGNGNKVRSRECISGICSLATTTELTETEACYESYCKSFLNSLAFSPRPALELIRRSC